MYEPMNSDERYCQDYGGYSDRDSMRRGGGFGGPRLVSILFWIVTKIAGMTPVSLDSHLCNVRSPCKWINILETTKVLEKSSHLGCNGCARLFGFSFEL